MELLLSILNRAGYIIDDNKNSIIDINNNEVGSVSFDGDLIIYSFSDGRKVIFDKTNNQVTVHMSDELDVVFRMITDSKSNSIFITLNMELSSGTFCSLEQHLKQAKSHIEYEVILRHKNLREDESVLFSKYAHNPSGIVYSYENGFISYTGALDPNACNLQATSQIILYTYLKPLITDSGLIDRSDARQINSIMDARSNIINDSTGELINYFLSYDFTENKKFPCGKIRLIEKQ